MATAMAIEQSAAGAPVLQEKTLGPLKTPIGAPMATCRPAERPALTEAQQAKYNWLLEQAKGWTEVKSHKGKGGPLTDDERMWLSRECLLRYLRATKWHEKEAAKRLQETLGWRRDYGVDELKPEYISPENETGKQIILGYDKEGRVCHYLNPGRQNTEPSARQVEHLVYMVERVIDLLPPGQETLALLINFKQSKHRSNTAPGIGQGRECLHILQTYYPERLGRALIINVPWVVWGFFKLITPFIDPLTREKLKFNEDMNQYVPSEQLWTEFDGKLQFEYDHSVYWPALNKLCEERRAARRARWVAGGKHVGESEDYMNGLLMEGVAPPPEEGKQPEGQQQPSGKAAEAAAEAAAVAAETAPLELKMEQLKVSGPSSGELEPVAEAKEESAEAPKAEVKAEPETQAEAEEEAKEEVKEEAKEEAEAAQAVEAASSEQK